MCLCEDYRGAVLSEEHDIVPDPDAGGWGGGGGGAIYAICYGCYVWGMCV